MAKEKKQIPKTTKKDFFYELSGTLTILLCLILLSELGAVGIFLKNLFKVIFGDFYFIVVFYLIAQGIFALVKERWFDFKSLRFNGFLLFILSLLLLVHISFLDVYNISSQSILANTIEVYKDILFNSNSSINSFGGGIIGAILSQIFVVLFNKIGAIIFSIIFIVLAFSLMTNLSFRSFVVMINFIIDKLKKFGILVYRYFANINYPNKKEKIKGRNILINLNLLTDVENRGNDLVQMKISHDEKDAIIRLIYQLNGYISKNHIQVGYCHTRFIFYGNFSNVVENKIDSLLNRKILFYNDKTQLIIEAPNKLKKLLSIKGLLLMNLTDVIPLGVEINDMIFYFNPIINQNILISGENGSGVKTFIKSFIITLIFRLKDKFNLVLCDYLDEFSDLKFLPNLMFPVNRRIEKLDDIIDELSVELEKRLNIINEYECENYIKLNIELERKKIKEILPIFVIVNNLDVIRSKGSDLSQKILYFLKFGYKVGIHFIMINRFPGVSGSIIANTKTKILLKTTTIEQSFEIIQSKNGCSLIGNGDAIIVSELSIYHVQLPYISDSDYHRVINKFILN